MEEYRREVGRKEDPGLARISKQSDHRDPEIRLHQRKTHYFRGRLQRIEFTN